MAGEIKYKRVLLVEGKDDKDFFKALLKHMGISDCYVDDVEGKDNFKTKIPALVKATGFMDNVEVFAVIRDADSDAEGSFKSICTAMQKVNLKPPGKMNKFSISSPKIGVYIMPGNFERGMLEDLCLKTVKGHPAMECVNIYMDCVKRLNVTLKNKAKSKAQAFLAAMPEIAASVGIGAMKGYWDFSSDELIDLREFVSNFK